MGLEIVFNRNLVSRIVKNTNWIHITFYSGNQMIYYTKDNSPISNTIIYQNINNVENILQNKYMREGTNYETVRDQLLAKPKLR